MTILKSLKLGIREVYRNFKFVWILWAFNSASALVVAMPIYYLLTKDLNFSLYNDRLVESFDFIWYLQFRHQYQTNIGEFVYIFLAVVGIYSLMRTFFLGGLVAVFNSPKKNHTVDFFYGGVKYWWRFIKIVVISLFFFALSFGINDLLGELIEYGYKNSEELVTEMVLSSIRYLLLLFLIGSVTLISDYSKIYLAIKDEFRIFYGIKESLKFLKNNFTIVFTVFFIVAAMGAAGVTAYNLAGGYIPKTPFYFLIVSFILQQMLIIFRLLIRMLFCSTEVIIFKDLSAEMVKAEITEEKLEF
ncbi:MAG: hypothetical protein K9J12_09580 [Melioribacteraceae bacterium]|nr:hypothetical protein [Melioribacteraceae bacterium]MCF8265291.1 hypothetical protein [Melioribacteraceae bacterium]